MTAYHDADDSGTGDVQNDILPDQTYAAPMSKAEFGYRGMPRDIIQLKDETLLMC